MYESLRVFTGYPHAAVRMPTLRLFFPCPPPFPSPMTEQDFESALIVSEPDHADGVAATGSAVTGYRSDVPAPHHLQNAHGEVAQDSRRCQRKPTLPTLVSTMPRYKPCTRRITM